MCSDIIVWMGVQQNNKLNVNLVLVYGPFLTYEWAVLDIHAGRFGPGYGPFLPFAGAVLVYPLLPLQLPLTFCLHNIFQVFFLFLDQFSAET